MLLPTPCQAELAEAVIAPGDRVAVTGLLDAESKPELYRGTVYVPVLRAALGRPLLIRRADD